VQPVGPVQHVFAWCDVYGAVEPTTGERFFLALPSLHAAMFPLCVDAFARQFPDRLHIRLLDNRGAHTAARLTLPENVRLLFLPPYGPELSPMSKRLLYCVLLRPEQAGGTEAAGQCLSALGERSMPPDLVDIHAKKASCL
jgi:hypothetical protein